MILIKVRQRWNHWVLVFILEPIFLCYCFQISIVCSVIYNWFLLTIFHCFNFLFFHKSFSKLAFVIIGFTRCRNSFIFRIWNYWYLATWLLLCRIILQSQNSQTDGILLMFKLGHKWILIFELVTEWFSVRGSDFVFFEVHIHVFFVFFFFFWF